MGISGKRDVARLYDVRIGVEMIVKPVLKYTGVIKG
jgi:hypothetical protein